MRRVYQGFRRTRQAGIGNCNQIKVKILSAFARDNDGNSFYIQTEIISTITTNHLSIELPANFHLFYTNSHHPLFSQFFGQEPSLAPSTYTINATSGCYYLIPSRLSCASSSNYCISLDSGESTGDRPKAGAQNRH